MCHHIVPQDAVTERLFNATIQTLELYGACISDAHSAFTGAPPVRADDLQAAGEQSPDRRTLLPRVA